MLLLINFLIFVMACIGLVFSSSLVVKSLIKVEKYYHLREFVVGFLLIGIVTSLPELFVGTISALYSLSSLSFGDILGSNVVNLALIAGVVAFIGKGIKFETFIEKRTIFIIAALTILPLILFLDGGLSRIDGVILISVFFFYLIRILMVRKKFKEVKNGKISKREVHKDIILLVVGLIILMASARVIVHAASEIAIELFLTPIVIGLVIVSIGTSLPEMFFEANSILRKHSSMAIGDLLGSLVFNSTLILGIVSIISPIQAPFLSFGISSIFIIISLLMFLVFARTGKEISRKEGTVLLIIYVLFVLVSILTR